MARKVSSLNLPAPHASCRPLTINVSNKHDFAYMIPYDYGAL
jgi:hypothetical protein